MAPTGPTHPTLRGRSADPRRTYLLAGVIALAGLLAAGAWASVGLLTVTQHPAGFVRIATPGVGEVTVDGTAVVYAEQSDATPAQITVTGPDRHPVRVEPYEADLRYDLPGSPGAVGRAVATFTVPVSGTYRVASSTHHGTLAVGPDLATGTRRALLWPGLTALAALAAGIALAVRTTTRRTSGD